MDVDAENGRAAARGSGNHPPGSPRDSMYGVESKKHRMHTGQDSEDFASRYELLEQLGSGASGTVWKCRLAPGHGSRNGKASGEEPKEGVVYAAKIIDLRPFKLRERFSMQRLMREVDIMRRLRHPNIISLVEALDTAEQLVLVLEYAPGVELFDAILSKNKFSEDEARPVFVQVARALQYMHSMKIVHRDVKPENVMIIDRPTEEGLYPEAKLLDFGLSKAIDAEGGGSMARTFVGTPSYLAPEVEEKQGGKGKPYGTPVDCWSLGAMLYVMLVARFPEFQVQGMRKYVRMQGSLWEKVSPEAKQLIQRLMAFDPGARLTVYQALRHPWLQEFAEKDTPPSPIQQPLPSGMRGMPSLSENMAFTVPEAVMRGSRGGREDSGGSLTRKVSQQSGADSWGSGSRPPIVTEQQTPPARSAKKSFEFTPSGPRIRELNSDDSPLSSLDSGMGEKVSDDRRSQRSPRESMTGNGSSDSHSNHDHNSSSNGDATGDDAGVNQTTMVAMYGARMGLSGPMDGGIPLLQLQNRISACLETAVTTYTECPEAAASLRSSATLCRESIRDSVTLLRKIERTAAQVITLFPDLILAVEEGEPDLAHDFFSTVKGWVREMYTAVSLVQARNSGNADKVNEAMTQHAQMGREAHRRREEELRHRDEEDLMRQRRQQRYEQERRSAATVFGAGYPGGIAGGVSGGVAGGGEAHVLKREGMEGLTGDLETDAARQGNLIAVDPDTFDAVRQIQALRNSLSNDEKQAADGSGPSAAATGRGDANATPPTPVDTLSDEKLINLFLLMARGSNWPGTRGTRGQGVGVGGGSSGGLAENGQGNSDVSNSGGGDGATQRMNGPEAMFSSAPNGVLGGGVGDVPPVSAPTHSAGPAVGVGPLQGMGLPSPSGNPGISADTTPTVTRSNSMSVGGGDSKSKKDGGGGNVDDAIAGLAAQMSIDDNADGTRDAAAAGRGGIAGGDGSGMMGGRQGRDSNGSDFASGRFGSEQRQDSGGRGETQLARRDEDKVYLEVQRALRMLHEVDSVLEQLALFWANSEVIFDVLLRKGDLVEKFVAFANKPRLMQRFTERLAEYKGFWEGVQGVCNKYICGQMKCTQCTTGPGGVPQSTAGFGADGRVPGTGTKVDPHHSSRESSVDDDMGDIGDGRKNSTSSAGSAGAGGDKGSRKGNPLKEAFLGGVGWENVEMGPGAYKST